MLPALTDDQRLEKQLQRKQNEGVLDLKCHVEVSGSTNVNDLKRVLADLFEREERGELPSRPLSSFKDWSELENFII